MIRDLVLAGHTSVSVVMDRYGHLYPQKDVASMDHLDDLLRDVSG